MMGMGEIAPRRHTSSARKKVVKNPNKVEVTPVDEPDTVSLEEEGDDERIPSLDSLDDLMTDLDEKRTSTRVQALHSLIILARHCILPDRVWDGRSATWVAVLSRLAHRGDDEEAILVMRLQAILCATFGEPAEALFQALAEDTSPKENPELAAAYANALAMSAFCCCTMPEHTVPPLLERFAELAREWEGPAREASIRGWALVATLLPRRQLVLQPRWFHYFTRFLDDDDLEVRQAAGRALALLWDARTRHIEESGDVAFDEQGLAAPAGGVGSTSGLRAHLLEHLRPLARISGHEYTRKEKSAQRHVFREIVETVEVRSRPPPPHPIPVHSLIMVSAPGCCPDVELEMGDQKVTFADWEKLTRYEAFKDIFAGGWKVHAEANEVVRGALDLGPPDLAVRPKTPLTALEKRLYMSPSSPAAKERTATRTSDRIRRANQTAFGPEDD
ncbi:hypothetical protein PAPYR_4006 [Paratrimastix pyriformis]|uniref:Interferon-related developmental regulator N-terminal domain-containing protein n=1 Tax=Paratrimastix pyriformis TaxID=342808 RepID=A0ABQ8UL64_9EUKA|nr:hypothetical protein PAPYR_4006 [Paratrimastix pyriformis]